MTKTKASLCRECRHYNPETKQCALMAACQNELVLVHLEPDMPCPIGKFEAQPVTAPQSGLFGEEVQGELIGLRAFGRLVGVELGSVQDAIDSGRISPPAVVQTKQGRKTGRKLRKAIALADWDSAHSQDEAGVQGGEPTGDRLTAEQREDARKILADPTPWGRLKTKFEAQLAEEKMKALQLERLELEGSLHSAADVAAVWDDILTRFRTKILSIPSEVAKVIVDMPNPEPASIQALLNSRLAEALSELSRYDTAQIATERNKRIGKG